jgi:hypothetical protein
MPDTDDLEWRKLEAFRRMNATSDPFSMEEGWQRAAPLYWQDRRVTRWGKAISEAVDAIDGVGVRAAARPILRRLRDEHRAAGRRIEREALRYLLKHMKNNEFKFRNDPEDYARWRAYLKTQRETDPDYGREAIRWPEYVLLAVPVEEAEAIRAAHPGEVRILSGRTADELDELVRYGTVYG